MSSVGQQTVAGHDLRTIPDAGLGMPGVDGLSWARPLRVYRATVQFYLLLIAFTGGFIVSVYPKYAPKKGWRVRRSLRQHGGAAASAGFASMAGAAIFIILRADWWMVAVLFAAGVAAGMLLIHLLKSTVQSLAPALIAFGWLWFVVVEVRW